MDTLFIIMGVLFTPVFLVLIVEYIVERLPETHRFVVWWRRNVVGVMDPDDDMF